MTTSRKRRPRGPATPAGITLGRLVDRCLVRLLRFGRPLIDPKTGRILTGDDGKPLMGGPGSLSAADFGVAIKRLEQIGFKATQQTPSFLSDAARDRLRLHRGPVPLPLPVRTGLPALSTDDDAATSERAHARLGAAEG